MWAWATCECATSRRGSKSDHDAVTQHYWMSNALLVAAGSVPDPATRVYAAPALSMLTPSKRATPATAATVVVPLSVPPPGLAPIASVTAPVKPVATLPKASRAVTSTAGVMFPPATVLVGWTVNTSCDAAAGVMAKLKLVTLSNPSDEKVSV